MQSKIIIIATLSLMLLGFSTLFIVEARNHDFDHKKNWVAVYFENPRDTSLDFAIENHQGEKITYSYKIFLNNDKMAESAVEIEAGSQQKISPALDATNLNGAKNITIIISNLDAEYKIYKNIQ